MKRLLPFLLTSLTAISGFRTLAGETGAFPSDITQGNIRCVLMSVGQTTVYPIEQDASQKAQAWLDGKQGVPCFTVTYLVEGLGDTPLGSGAAGNVEVLVGGKPLHGIRNSYVKAFDYNVFQAFLDFSKPKVSNPKRARIVQMVLFGAVTNTQPLNLSIETGFAKDIQKFQFDSIRLQ